MDVDPQYSIEQGHLRYKIHS